MKKFHFTSNKQLRSRKQALLKKVATLGIVTSMVFGTTLPTFASVAETATTVEQSFEVIVTYKNDEGKQAAIEKSVEVKNEISSISSLLVVATKSNLLALSQNENITSIQGNAEVNTIGEVVGTLAAANSEQSHWSYQAVNPGGLSKEKGITGQGVKVAVIDSGVALHSDLNIKNRLSFMQDNVATPVDESSPDDHNGHGTHVAGIIAAQLDGVGTVGIAPDVELHSLKVTGADGIGTVFDLIQAIDWAIKNNIDIINISLGLNVDVAALRDIIHQAEEKGVTIVAAAGNDKGPVNYPAAYSSAIAVSALNQSKSLATFSSRGTQVEFTAPGVGVPSTHLNNSYVLMQGTSQASPHVAGLLALLKQKHPEKTNIELRAELIKYVEDLGTEGRDSLFGHGLPSFQILSNDDQISPAHQAKIDELKALYQDEFLTNAKAFRAEYQDLIPDSLQNDFDGLTQLIEYYENRIPIIEDIVNNPSTYTLDQIEEAISFVTIIKDAFEQVILAIKELLTLEKDDDLTLLPQLEITVIPWGMTVFEYKGSFTWDGSYTHDQIIIKNSRGEVLADQDLIFTGARVFIDGVEHYLTVHIATKEITRGTTVGNYINTLLDLGVTNIVVKYSDGTVITDMDLPMKNGFVIEADGVITEVVIVPPIHFIFIENPEGMTIGEYKLLHPTKTIEVQEADGKVLTDDAFLEDGLIIFIDGKSFRLSVYIDRGPSTQPDPQLEEKLTELNELINHALINDSHSLLSYYLSYGLSEEEPAYVAFVMARDLLALAYAEAEDGLAAGSLTLVEVMDLIEQITKLQDIMSVNARTLLDLANQDRDENDNPIDYHTLPYFYFLSTPTQSVQDAITTIKNSGFSTNVIHFEDREGNVLDNNANLTTGSILVIDGVMYQILRSILVDQPTTVDNFTSDWDMLLGRTPNVFNRDGVQVFGDVVVEPGFTVMFGIEIFTIIADTSVLGPETPVVPQPSEPTPPPLDLTPVGDMVFPLPYGVEIEVGEFRAMQFQLGIFSTRVFTSEGVEITDPTAIMENGFLVWQGDAFGVGKTKQFKIIRTENLPGDDDPIDPVVPAPPEEPIDPVDPAPPGEPTDPVDPAPPGEPIDPVVPAPPEEPIDPVDPAPPGEPTDPVDPAPPGEPNDPVVPAPPVEPIVPVVPAPPVEPIVPVVPAPPVEPIVPVVPAPPVVPTNPIVQLPVGPNPGVSIPTTPTIEEEQKNERDQKLPKLNNERVNLVKVADLVTKAKENTPTDFKDVPKGHFSANALATASKLGIIKGRDDGSFDPNGNITRAEVAVMLVRALGLNVSENVSFVDSQNHWAGSAIQALKDAGIISGYGDGTFRPNQSITRAEIAAILSRVIEMNGKLGAGIFTDSKGHWAESSINMLNSAGVIRGKSETTFAPAATATRAELVTMIIRLLNVTLDLDLEV